MNKILQELMLNPSSPGYVIYLLHAYPRLKSEQYPLSFMHGIRTYHNSVVSCACFLSLAYKPPPRMF